MTRIVKTALNTLVRSYLRHCPVTEGKQRLLALTRNYIMPDEPAVSFRTKHGFSLQANLRNPEHQRMYFYGEHDERYEINNIVKILQAGDCCWDIGANIGFYTCLFATLVGDQGRVIAFEPVSATSGFLGNNIGLNGFRHVTLKKLALGDAPGRQQIFLDLPDKAEGTVSLKTAAGAHSETIDVETIDNLAASLPVPDFIKIDVEGYQMKVFAGGEKFFSRHSPMIMAELRDRDRTLMNDAQVFLRAHGYLIYEFRKHALKRCENILDSRGRNFFMVKENSPYFSRVRPQVE
ncbi:MAG: FkbM family methyltransferase [Sulfuricaulis sp.]|nr:FkbM family methyltransferase [Sulfuricaulis sp.]